MEFKQSLTQFHQEAMAFDKLFLDTNSGRAQVQKVMSGPHFIILDIRFKAKSIYLFLGRGGPYQGFYLSEKRMGVENKLLNAAKIYQDRFLEYLRKALKNAYILGAQYPYKDRQISFKIAHSVEREEKILFFWKGAELQFAHLRNIKDSQSRWQFFSSRNERWQELPQSFGKSFEGFIFPDLRTQEKSADIPFTSSIAEASFLTNYGAHLQEILNKEIKVKHSRDKKFLEKKRKKILGEIAKADAISELQELAEDLEHLNSLSSKVELCGVKINFESLSLYRKRDLIYQKIKGLKKGKKINQSRLLELEEELRRLKEKEGSSEHETAILAATKTLKRFSPYPGREQKALASSSPHRDAKGEKLLRHFMLRQSGLEGMCGISDRGNDKVRVLSNKKDLWFHLYKRRSAHLTLKAQQVDQLAPNELQAIASLLRDRGNNYRFTEIEIIVAQVGDLRAISATPGAVRTIRQEVFKVLYLPDWREYFTGPWPGTSSERK